jgi:hypothetical protein
MPNYEYKKEYNKKWNDNNTKTITIRLSNSQYDKLQKYCKDNNIARATIIKSRISDIID